MVVHDEEQDWAGQSLTAVGNYYTSGTSWHGTTCTAVQMQRHIEDLEIYV